MKKRFASIWFRHLTTDWFAIRRPQLRETPFVLVAPTQGRMLITAANPIAEKQGVEPGMVIADAKAILPSLKVFDDRPKLTEKLLRAIGLWCIRYTPLVAMDYPDGLILDISGCTHLWGGERDYLKEIVTRLRTKGYNTRMAIADTMGTAWAVARFGKETPLIEDGAQLDALLSMPPAALRLEEETVQQLYKLGLKTIGSFVRMPHSVLRTRFGAGILQRINQALGVQEEFIQPLKPIAPYEERLPCLDPIRTDKGIEIALKHLLDGLCKRLSGEGKGLREAILQGYRVDGKMVQVAIGTSRATANALHIFKLFALKIPQIEPALGIELFVLEAPKVEDADPRQEAFWGNESKLEDNALTELLDKLKGRKGTCFIHRYLPDEHHWPERSIKIAVSTKEKPTTAWCSCRPRPTRLLPTPEPIEVTAPIPDYPPMLFRYKGKVHPIKRADGPERIEREWWMDKGEHRDYYYVEDDKGQRYWLFRLGHYSGDDRTRQWYLHGFFA